MGRKSKGNYPPGWDLVARFIKDKAGWQCIRCGHKHDQKSGHVLTVHHLDLDKSNCRWWNLAALCQRCHLSVQGRVDMHRIWMLDHTEWIKPYVAGYYAHLMGMHTADVYAQEYITKNADSIIGIFLSGKGSDDYIKQEYGRDPAIRENEIRGDWSKAAEAENAKPE